MTTSATIVLGIISGMLATFLTSLAVLFWKDVVMPKIHAMRYSGLLISGKWKCNPVDFSQTITIEIDQIADQLTGTAIFVSEDKSNTDHEEIRSFVIKGFIKDGLIALHSLSGKQNRLGIHTFLMQASGDGRELVGIMTYYSVSGKSRNSISSLSTKFLHESCSPIPISK